MSSRDGFAPSGPSSTSRRCASGWIWRKLRSVVASILHCLHHRDTQSSGCRASPLPPARANACAWAAVPGPGGWTGGGPGVLGKSLAPTASVPATPSIEPGCPFSSELIGAVLAVALALAIRSLSSAFAPLLASLPSARTLCRNSSERALRASITSCSSILFSSRKDVTASSVPAGVSAATCPSADAAGAAGPGAPAAGGAPGGGGPRARGAIGGAPGGPHAPRGGGAPKPGGAP
mmetsp:Transcript_1173/g.3260  ORF Transcript_1173/g.3260 Transcript_1173/m.3260 type:complete len:235 (-) Transcript_1173:1552-2256(-)